MKLISFEHFYQRNLLMNKIISFVLYFFIITNIFIFNSVKVEAHYIDDNNVELKDDIIDKELDTFKNILKGVGILKAEDMEEEEYDEDNDDNENIENENNENLDEKVNSTLGPISLEINTSTEEKNMNGDNAKNENNKNDIVENNNNNNINDNNSNNNSNNNNNNINDKDNVDKNDNIENENNNGISNNTNTNNNNSNEIKNEGVENQKDNNNNNNNNNNIDNNSNKNLQNVKKVKVLSSHKNYKFKGEEEKELDKVRGKENGGTGDEDTKGFIKFIIESGEDEKGKEENENILDNKEEDNIFGVENSEEYKVMDAENDEEIKDFVRYIVETEGHHGDEAKEKEIDMFNKIKLAISNNKLEKLAKAKQEDLKKGIKFSKPMNKTGEDKAKGVFKVEETYAYKCYYDQDCTNFKGFTPDVASCNKTSTHCSNYCFIQKACLEDFDCSTSCGSWCLKDTDMVFGRCVMSFDENDFCMESWRVCKDGLVCNMNSFVCEKPRIPLTFTRIDSQESLLSIIIFLIIAIFLIKNSRNRDFISFFSGYNLNEYCSNMAQEYDPLPEYQRTEELNPEEMNDLVEGGSIHEPPNEPNEEGYIVENENEPLYCGYYDENNQSVNCNYIPVRPEVPQTPLPQTIENTDVNVITPSVASLSDSNVNIINEPPPDYEE